MCTRNTKELNQWIVFQVGERSCSVPSTGTLRAPGSVGGGPPLTLSCGLQWSLGCVKVYVQAKENLVGTS